MMRHAPTTILALCLFASACGKDEPAKPLAQKKEELAVPEKSEAPSSQTLVIESSSSEVGFEMEAPMERQFGEIPPSAVTGQLTIDPTDITKSTGLVDVDLDELVIYQEAADDDGEFGERTKSDLQNEHMKDWLEIGPDAPPEDAKKNKLAQFSLEKVTDASASDITQMNGSERKVTFTGEGEFRLHQRVSKKSVPFEATFHYDGDALTSVDVQTTKPLLVDLAEHDVRPRTAFGKLAEKTLDAMAPKVAKEAEVSVAFTAKPKL